MACRGLASRVVQPLIQQNHQGSFGSLSTRYMYQLAKKVAPGMYNTEQEMEIALHHCDATGEAAAISIGTSPTLLSHLPLYKVDVGSLCSTMCLEVSTGGDTCAACELLEKEGSVVKRLKRIATRVDAHQSEDAALSTASLSPPPSKFTRHAYLSPSEVRTRLKETVAKNRKQFFVSKALQRDLERSERQRKRAEQKLESSLEKDNCPKFLRAFITAAEQGCPLLLSLLEVSPFCICRPPSV
jgi:hypothetical protein